MREPLASSFADMAVALTMASSKLQLDMAQTENIANRIGVSAMGLELTLEGMRRDAALVHEAQELLKRMVDIEPQIRAAIARKENGRWFPRLAASVAAL